MGKLHFDVRLEPLFLTGASAAGRHLSRQVSKLGTKAGPAQRKIRLDKCDVNRSKVSTDEDANGGPREHAGYCG